MGHVIVYSVSSIFFDAITTYPYIQNGNTPNENAHNANPRCFCVFFFFIHLAFSFAIRLYRLQFPYFLSSS